MADEKGRLIDDRKAEPTLRKDRPRPLPASARVEIVAVEKEQHDARPLDTLEQRVEPDRIEAPGLVEFVEAAKGRRGGRDDRIDIIRGIGGHQREKGAERLPGQHEATISFMLELGDVIDETPRAVDQGVTVARAIEAQYIPATLAQHSQKGRRRRFGVFDRQRAAVVPDDSSRRALRPEHVLIKRWIEPLGT